MIPIPTAIPLVRTAVYAALSPLAGTYNGAAKAYWLVAAQGAPLPLLVFQSQDAGGRDTSFINNGGWSGLITVKALAVSPAACEALLAGVPTAMEGIGQPSGYSLTATFARPLVLPPSEDVWQCGQIWLLELYRD